MTDSLIIENKTYYIVFDSPDNDYVKAQMSSQPLASCVSWHPGNRVAELAVKNHIGKIRVFDREIEVRSEKFDDSLDGLSQLKLIIDELDDLSKKISFTYSSKTFLHSLTDWDNYENDLMYKINYLYQVFFKKYL